CKLTLMDKESLKAMVIETEILLCSCNYFKILKHR
ncbi:unnamed protein product, partial [marine sediment metagenome]